MVKIVPFGEARRILQHIFYVKSDLMFNITMTATIPLTEVKCCSARYVIGTGAVFMLAGMLANRPRRRT
jgi:hypothetical protein